MGADVGTEVGGGGGGVLGAGGGVGAVLADGVGGGGAGVGTKHVLFMAGACTNAELFCFDHSPVMVEAVFELSWTARKYGGDPILDPTTHMNSSLREGQLSAVLRKVLTVSCDAP